MLQTAESRAIDSRPIRLLFVTNQMQTAPNQALARVIGERYSDAAGNSRMTGRLTGLSRMCFSAGQAVSPILAIFVYQQLGPAWPWLLGAVLRALILSMYALLGGREAASPHRQRHVRGIASQPSSATASTIYQRTFAAISTRLANPSALLLQASIRSANNARQASKASEKAAREALKIAAVEGIESIDLFTCLTAEQRRLLIANLEFEVFDQGDNLIQQGDTEGKLYIITRGTVCVTRLDESGVQTTLAEALGKGSYIGEMALLESQPRMATVTATSALQCVSLDQQKFLQLMGSALDVLRKEAARRKQADLPAPSPAAAMGKPGTHVEGADTAADMFDETMPMAEHVVKSLNRGVQSVHGWITHRGQEVLTVLNSLKIPGTPTLELDNDSVPSDPCSGRLDA